MAKQEPTKKPQPAQPAAAAHPIQWRTLINGPAALRALVIVQLLILAVRFFPDMSTNGDDAQYYLLGKSLVSGEGYRKPYDPARTVETQYPVVFPAFLGAVSVFSQSPLPAKIVNAFTAVLATILAWYLFRSRLTHLLMPLLACMAVSGFIAEYSVILMSEVPYVVLTLLALVLLDRSLARPQNRLLFWATIAASVLPTNCRSIGVSFTAAWVIACLWNRHYRYAVWHAVIFLGASVLFRTLTSWDNPYVLQLFLRNSYDPAQGYVTVAEMVARIGQNIGRMHGQLIRLTLIPTAKNMSQGLNGVMSNLIVIAIFIGWLRGLIGRLRLASLYVFFYLGIMTVWQTQWTSERFVLGIIPFLYLFLFTGLDTVVAFFRTDRPASFAGFLRELSGDVDGPAPAAGRRWLAWSAAAVIVLFNLSYNFTKGNTAGRLTRDWTNYYSCADWVRTNTSKDAVVVSRKAELFYIRAQRKGYLYPYSHDPDSIVRNFRDNKVTHVVFDNFFWTRTTQKYLYPVYTKYPGMFKPVYMLKDPDTYIMEFNPQ